MATDGKFHDYHLAEYLNQQSEDIVLNLPKEYTSAKQVYELEVLRQKTSMFMDCDNIMFMDDVIRFTYTKPTRFRTMSDVKNKTDLEKLQILKNLCNYFENKNDRFFTLFCPDNVYYTDSSEVMFMYRGIVDLMPPDNQNSIKELEDFKNLILSILQSKYSYVQLEQMGMDILGKDEFYSSIINVQTIDGLRGILETEYDKRYEYIAGNKIAFKRRNVNVFFIVMSAVMAVIIAALGYFAYRNIAETNKYKNAQDLYEAYYIRHVDRVVELADRISEADMNHTVKLVVADAYIATDEIDNLKKAFVLDSTRQMEIIQRIIDLESPNEIVDLVSDNVKVQLYQAYYKEDYARVIDVALTQPELVNDAQAKTLLAKSYQATRQYTKAREVAESMGDKELQIEILEAHYADVKKNETDPEKRKITLETIDSMLKTLKETSPEQPAEQPTETPKEQPNE